MTLKLPFDFERIIKEVNLTFIRAPGPGGQHVNKVATAVQLRFNVTHSAALSAILRARVLTTQSSRLTTAGDLIIKASRYRTQERNRQDALLRLKALLQCATRVPKKRRPTKPSLSAVQKRLTAKQVRGQHKSLRRKRVPQEE